MADLGRSYDLHLGWRDAWSFGAYGMGWDGVGL